MRKNISREEGNGTDILGKKINILKMGVGKDIKLYGASVKKNKKKIKPFYN